MRWKIIIVNGLIVAIVGVLSFVFLATALSDRLSNPTERKAAVERAVRSANAQLALDGLRVERWLAAQAEHEEVRGVFSLGTAQARGAAATAQADKIREAAEKESDFANMLPSLVLFLDASGSAVGRNGSKIMRGDRMGESYPSILEALKSVQTSSAVWLNKERHEQMLASYAPVRGEGGTVVGLIVVGTPLNDERMSRTSELTSGQALMIAVPSGDASEVIARSGSQGLEVLSAASAPDALKGAQNALASGNFQVVETAQAAYVVGAAPLAGYHGSRAAIVTAVPASAISNLLGILWPILAVSGMGLALVFLGGTFIGNYVSQPISELEEGLLAVINGNTELRFDLEHAELGGLVSRINSLLNALMGVPETDDAGRTAQQEPAGEQAPPV